MLKILVRFRATVVAILLAGFIYALTSLTDIDVFERIVEFMTTLEDYEADEIAVGLVLVLIGVTVDLMSIKRRREQRIEIFRQRLGVLHATMRTVLDIVGNFLNQLMLFRIQAEGCKDFPPESIKKIDSMINETATRLKAIGDLEDTPEKKVSAGFTVIDVDREK